MSILDPLVGDTHLILTRPDGRVLLLIRSGTGYLDGHASLPAGHIDPGESADQAAIREGKEEVGVVVQPRDLAFAHVMHRRTSGEFGSRVSFFFAACAWTGEPVNAEPHRCAGLLWADPVDLWFLPIPVVGYIADALSAIRAGTGYSAHGWAGHPSSR